MLDIILIAVGSSRSAWPSPTPTPATGCEETTCSSIHPGRRGDRRPARLSGLRAAAPRAVLSASEERPMTFNGWIQIALFCVVVVAAREAARRLHDPRLRRRAHLPVAVLRPGRARRSTALGGVDEREEQHWLDLCRRHAAVQPRRASSSSTRCMRLQAVLPFNPAGHVGGPAGPRLQHRRQLHHQHQLAVLRRRDDDELSRPDGRADGAQLRLGRDRHRARGRADPRLRARSAQHASAISGST